jgi:FMN phosphatase YigB (HAD superfamily)
MKYLKNITNSSLTQTKNKDIFYHIYSKLEELDFRDRETILQGVLQNVCTTLDKDMLYELTELIIDVSFNDNVVWFLLSNNNSENLGIITNRPDVKATAIFKQHQQILELFDVQKFRKDFPEFWL